MLKISLNFFQVNDDSPMSHSAPFKRNCSRLYTKGSYYSPLFWWSSPDDMTATNHVEILPFYVRSEWPWTIQWRSRGLTSAGSKISFGRRASIKASGANTLMSILPACSSCHNEWNECGRGEGLGTREGGENEKARREMAKNETEKKHWVRSGLSSHTRSSGEFSVSGLYGGNEWYESAFISVLLFWRTIFSTQNCHEFVVSQNLLSN